MEDHGKQKNLSNRIIEIYGKCKIGTWRNDISKCRILNRKVDGSNYTDGKCTFSVWEFE